MLHGLQESKSCNVLETVESETRSRKSSHMNAIDLTVNLQFLLYHLLSPAQSLLVLLLPLLVLNTLQELAVKSSKHFTRKMEVNQAVKVNWPIIWATPVLKGQWIATHHSQQPPANSTKLPTFLQLVPALFVDKQPYVYIQRSLRKRERLCNVFKLRYFDRYKLSLCNNVSRK